MPRHCMTMKDVAACDKPREGGKQPLIRGFPNGETQSCEAGLQLSEFIGQLSAPWELKHLSTKRNRKNKRIL